MDDVLARLGITEALASEPFDSRGILEGAQGGIQFPRCFVFLFEVHIQSQFILAHPLVLLDHRLVPEENSEHRCDDQQGQHHPK